MHKYTKEQIRAGAASAGLSYVFFVCFFILAYKENKFARFHAKQGLVLFIGLILCWILGALLPILGSFFSVFGTILYLFCSVFGVFKSLMGKEAAFPVVTKIADKLVI